MPEELPPNKIEVVIHCDGLLQDFPAAGVRDAAASLCGLGVAAAVMIPSVCQPSSAQTHWQ